MYEPREDSYLIEKYVKEFAHGEVLEIGCGSGILMEAALKKSKDVEGVDVDDEAGRYGKKKGLNVKKSNLLENVKGKFDYIFANPPYIDPTKKATVEESVLRHEPHGALFAGSGGLAFITQLLAEARAHLHQGGILMIEFGANQKEDIARLARAHSWNIEFEKDQFGEWRIATLRPRP